MGLRGLALQCVVCASCQGPRGSLKVSGLNEPPRLDGCMRVCCCVTVGEYHDIKQHHSGLCALTQETLCTFLQGLGDGDEAKVVVVGGQHGGYLPSVLSHLFYKCRVFEEKLCKAY